MALRRPAVAAALVGVLVGAAAAAPAQATPAPSAQQLADAARRVREAQSGLADVQVRAELAAEAYHGAQIAAAAAERDRAAAQAAADGARAASSEAARVAAAAQGVADEAAAAAVRARREADTARAAAAAAQEALDALAAGAYRSGGSLPLLSAMLDAGPTEFATGRAMMNRADEHQRRTVDALTAARAHAVEAAGLARGAQVQADAEARAVGEKADAARATATAAASSAAAAAAAARTATRTAAEAEAARTTALVLVAAAERALGSATADSSRLQAQAAQARREAEIARRSLPVPSAPGPAGTVVATAIRAAYGQIGVPYSWGGGTARGPSRGFAQGARTVGFDCSGLTLYAYAQAGIHLDHFTGSQWRAGRHVSREELAPGDLVFFATDTGDPSTIHHVGLYLGGGRMIEAPHTGDVVKVSGALRSDLIGGVRLTG